MNQDDTQQAPHQPGAEMEREETGDAAVPATPAGVAAPVEARAPNVGDDPDDTVGTGTSIALGCIAGTLLLIVIGLIFIGILAIL